MKPNLRLLGPKLGAELASLRQALEAGEFEELADGGFRAAGHDLSADEVLVERRGKEGWSVAASDGVTVALDSRLDDELRREGRVYDLIHRVNSMRKEAGLELTDRIALTLPETDRDLLEHEDWIARETLAVSVDADGLGAGDREEGSGFSLTPPSQDIASVVFFERGALSRVRERDERGVPLLPVVCGASAAEAGRVLSRRRRRSRASAPGLALPAREARPLQRLGRDRHGSCRGLSRRRRGFQAGRVRDHADEEAEPHRRLAVSGATLGISRRRR